MSVFYVEKNRLIRKYDSEILWIEPWGKNSLRVRPTKLMEMPEDNWALLPCESSAEIHIEENTATIVN